MLRDTGVGFMKPVALLSGRIVFWENLTRPRPADTMTVLEDRPVYIVHGDADSEVNVHHATLFMEALNGENESVMLWITPGTGHVASMIDYPEEYETRLTEFFTLYLK
jgi:fermentation-respiration switch protein FrsA (DUF1100 family)